MVRRHGYHRWSGTTFPEHDPSAPHDEELPTGELDGTEEGVSLVDEDAYFTNGPAGDMETAAPVRAARSSLLTTVMRTLRTSAVTTTMVTAPSSLLTTVNRCRTQAR